MMQVLAPPHRARTPLALHLPEGLIGMSDLKRFELIAEADSLPFQILKSLDTEPIEFVVVEPQGIFSDYPIEINDEDASQLGLASAEDPTLVLNILTIRSREPQCVTANLVAPIVVNRASGEGRQIVLSNYRRYSTTYPLIGAAA